MRDDFNQIKRSFDDVIYIAQKDIKSELDDYGNKTYCKPKKLFCCVSPLDGYTDVIKFILMELLLKMKRLMEAKQTT